MSEKEQFFTSRWKIVVFVQRVWQNIKQAGEIKRNDESPLYITNPSKGGFPDCGRSNNYSCGNSRRRGGHETGINGFRRGFWRRYNRGRRGFRGNSRRRENHSNDISFRLENKYPDNQNNKKESYCYKYSSIVHFITNCNRFKTVKPIKFKKRFEKSPKIHPTKILKKATVKDTNDKNDSNLKN